MTKYEYFCEKFSELSDEEKINLYNEWARDNDCDNEIFAFDDEFFEMFFSDKPADAVRAAFFGDIKNWSDDYIKFNGYGNLESLSCYDAIEDWVTPRLEEIFNDDHYSYYIDIVDWDWEENVKEYLKQNTSEDEKVIEQFIEEELFGDEDDEDVEEMFKEWLQRENKELK